MILKFPSRKERIEDEILKENTNNEKRETEVS